MPDTNGGRMLTAPETRLANRAVVSLAYHLTSDGELALVSFTKRWPVFRDAVEEILSEGSQQ
jgi:hypothetical protein